MSPNELWSSSYPKKLLFKMQTVFVKRTAKDSSWDKSLLRQKPLLDNKMCRKNYFVRFIKYCTLLLMPATLIEIISGYFLKNFWMSFCLGMILLLMKYSKKLSTFWFSLTPHRLLRTIAFRLSICCSSSPDELSLSSMLVTRSLPEASAGDRPMNGNS